MNNISVIFNILGPLIFPIVMVIIFTVVIKRKLKKGNLLETLTKMANTSDKKIPDNPEMAFKSTLKIFGVDSIIQDNQPSALATVPFTSEINGIMTLPAKPARLSKKNKYLHIALNSTLEEARDILSKLTYSERILIEVGTPLIKIYGEEAIRYVKSLVPPNTYIVADNKCADMAEREVEMVASAGANASTCLGISPVETIEEFILQCEKRGIDSFIDMMNVENALAVLKKLKKLPTVVMLHRGVDESEFSKEKQIPLYQIKQIKGSYDLLVAVAGGDTIREVQRAILNDADIVVVWKNFYTASDETAELASSFLKEI